MNASPCAFSFDLSVCSVNFCHSTCDTFLNLLYLSASPQTRLQTLKAGNTSKSTESESVGQGGLLVWRGKSRGRKAARLRATGRTSRTDLLPVGMQITLPHCLTSFAFTKIPVTNYFPDYGLRLVNKYQ